MFEGFFKGKDGKYRDSPAVLARKTMLLLPFKMGNCPVSFSKRTEGWLMLKGSKKESLQKKTVGIPTKKESYKSLQKHRTVRLNILFFPWGKKDFPLGNPFLIFFVCGACGD